jgi:hypothetical protein
MTGQQVSHYRIEQRLGQGGMGVVYEAEDLRLGRKVAVKFLPDEACCEPEAVERFMREARAISALNHPHICTLYDIGEADGQHYMAMERLEGEPLKARLSPRTTLDLDATWPWLLVMKARTLAALGRDDEAHAAYAEFFGLWKDADPDVPLLVAARAADARRR